MGEELGFLRLSDTDREHALNRLNRAVGEGRLRLDELGGRADAVLAAATMGELDRVLADLLSVSARSEPPALVLRTTNGRIRQTGEWAVPPQIVAHCGIGRIRIDFTNATCAHREVIVRASLHSAGAITLIVPRGWLVRVEEVQATRGGVRNKATERAREDAPLIRVFANVGSGRVKIRH